MIKSYNELTVGKYQEVRAIELEGREPIDIQTELLSILSDMDEKTLMELPLTEYKRYAEMASFLTVPLKNNNKCPKEITINGKVYSVTTEVKKMTAGQYIDYQTYMGFNNIDRYLVHLLSCFIIPKGHKYNDGYDIEELMDDIKAMPIDIAYSITGFFLHRLQSLTKATLTYLILKTRMQMMITKDKETKRKMKLAVKEMTLAKDFLQNGLGHQQ